MSATEVPCGNCGHAATIHIKHPDGQGGTIRGECVHYLAPGKYCPCTTYVPAVTVDQAKAAVLESDRMALPIPNTKPPSGLVKVHAASRMHCGLVGTIETIAHINPPYAHNITVVFDDRAGCGGFAPYELRVEPEEVPAASPEDQRERFEALMAAIEAESIFEGPMNPEAIQNANAIGLENSLRAAALIERRFCIRKMREWFEAEAALSVPLGELPELEVTDEDRQAAALKDGEGFPDGECQRLGNLREKYFHKGSKSDQAKIANQLVGFIPRILRFIKHIQGRLEYERTLRIAAVRQLRTYATLLAEARAETARAVEETDALALQRNATNELYEESQAALAEAQGKTSEAEGTINALAYKLDIAEAILAEYRERVDTPAQKPLDAPPVAPQDEEKP